MKQTPFINGGLFDCLDSEEATGKGGYRLDCFSDNNKHRKLLSVPNRLFFDDQRGLFPLFNKYKFTVEENTPIEQEVALDPELLGKVFENLLAAYNPATSGTARKQTGSYYTPRAIVDYMVDEALVASLAEKVKPTDGDSKFWQERLHYLLDYADACNDAKELFDEKEADGIVRAISEIKVLDPAAGSGAFPMGVLHKLTLALGKLDPENKCWRELQKKRAVKETEVAYSEQKDRAVRDALLQEISDTFERYSSDFGRKLYLIQNSIFGVDIQPVACQIAKLRFFISLAIEQRRDDNQENYGIKPLPNLETRFVAADTLIGLQLTQRDALQSAEIRTLEEQLQQNRERHFNAGTRRKKLECSRKDRELRSSLAEILKTHYQRDGVWQEALQINDKVTRTLTAQLNKYNAQITATKQATLMVDANPRETQMTDEKVAKLEQKITDKQKLAQLISKRDEAVRDNEIWEQAKFAAEKKNEMIHAEAQKIAAWDPYDQNAKADWFDAEWMFGVTDGFDVVIGNPPYAQLQRDGGRLGNLYKNCNYQTFTRMGDIYMLFYERGLNLLTSDGLLCYITSNKWMRTGYGKSIRKLLAQTTTLRVVVDFGELPVFEAGTDPTIVLTQNNTSTIAHHCTVAVIKDAADIIRVGEVVQQQGFVVAVTDLSTDGWTLESPAVLSLLEKIRGTGKLLGKYVQGNIYYGVKTGYNEAFVIDEATKELLITQDPKSAELIKPWLRGRDIKKWRAEWSEDYLLFVQHDCKIDSYPAVKKHLEKFKLRLLERSTPGPDKWFAIQANTTYHKDFLNPKIVFNETSKELHAFVDYEKLYINKTGFIILAPDNGYLLGVMNSKMMDYYYRHTFPAWGDPWHGGRVQFRGDRMTAIPIAAADQNQRRQIAQRVHKIMEASQNPETAKLETEIDQLVYQLYALTDEQIETIEKSYQ